MPRGHAVIAGYALLCLGVLTAAGVTAPPAAAVAPDRAQVAVPTLAGVSCRTVSTCVVVGSSSLSDGSAFTTADAGAHWAHTAHPATAGSLSAAACPTALVCFVAGGGTLDEGALFRTTDGGARWTRTDATVGGGSFLDIACPSVRTCVATGTGGTVDRTDDGGASWRVQSVPASASIIQSVSCPTTSTCVAVGYGGGAGGMVLVTTDSGRTWQQRRLPPRTSFVDSVTCPTSRVCVAAGTQAHGDGFHRHDVAAVLVTRDGGATWSMATTLPADDGQPKAVACGSTTRCELTTNLAAFGSVDAGRTWHRQRLPAVAAGAQLQDLACPGPDVCYLAGQTPQLAGFALRTGDAGATWHRQPLGAARQL